LQDWYCKSLENYGFEIKQNIVVLSWNGSIPVIQNKTPQILLRPMEPSDLQDVFWLDNLAFEPLWSFSNSALQKAYQQSEHATVAELDENIIGYELTTANHFSAHLARLAVHPEYTNKNIGSRLVIEMLAYFSKNGQKQITVNTQNDNSASLAVYKKLGFSLTGDTFPVYQLHIN
jgi:ribosomal-protein-alanine N-acetyltransferase